MKKYELVVMFPPEHNDVSCEKNIAEKCKKCGVKVETVDKLGMKPLAYPIKKNTKAYYLRYSLEAEAEEVVALEKAIRLDESVLRYLLVALLESKQK